MFVFHVEVAVARRNYFSCWTMDGVEAHVDETELRRRLVEHGQDQLMKFWDHLSESEQRQLTAELSSIDLAYVSQCYEACVGDLKRTDGNCDKHLQPLPESVVGSVVRSDPETLELYEHEGLELCCVLVGFCFILVDR